MRKEYQLSKEQLGRLLEASKPTPMIMLQCGTPPSPQEKANVLWKSFAEEMGFIWDTVAPAGKKSDPSFFTAKKKEPVNDL